MAVIKAVHSKASIGNVINYVIKEEKTEEKLITGKDCNPYYSIDEMKVTKDLWHKNNGRQYDHYVQSFATGEGVKPEIAHNIATQWAENQFKGYECLIATHTDRGHTHSHIIVNSISYEDGRKIHTSAKWLEQAKKDSDRLCLEYGLSVTEKGKTFSGETREDMTSFDKDKYQFLQKAGLGKVKSYVLDAAVVVMQIKTQANSKADFVLKMEERGYKTNWTDRHKHITFTNQDGNRVRNSNIENTFKVNLTKEELEREFEQNRRRKNSRNIEANGFKEYRNKPGAENYSGTSHEIHPGNSVSENEPVRSGADESGERATQTDFSRLHEQLQQIRGIDKKYDPAEQRKRAENLKQAEQPDRAETDRARQENQRKNEQPGREQHHSKPKHKRHHRER